MRRTVFALLALAAVLALAGTPANAAEDKPAAPKSCVTLNWIKEQRIGDDHTIYFREGSKWYHNDFGGSCPMLTPMRAIRSRTPSNQLCSGDIIAIFDPSSRMEFGSCGLREFVPSAPPPPSARH